MESKAKIFKHAAHPILMVFPLGLLSTAVIFDVVHLITGKDTFALVAYWMIVAGIVGGLAAAVPGAKDWLAIPAGTRAKRIGMIHGLGNVLVLLLFVGSWLLRRDEPSYVPSTLALILSFVAFATAGVTGWLGSELVERLGVAVYNGANLNASNSLSGRPASEPDSAFRTTTDGSGRLI